MLDSLADLHWKLGDSGSAFADWNSALALQPKEALRTAIQARARDALMALLRGEQGTGVDGTFFISSAWPLAGPPKRSHAAGRRPGLVG